MFDLRAFKINSRRAVIMTAVFFITGLFLFHASQALSRGESSLAEAQKNVAEVIPVVIKAQEGPTAGSPSNSEEKLPGVLPDAGYDFSGTKAGVYTGPGDISGHNNFENWLGSSVPYATDYIDYKGGWSKDFRDSKLWLMQPWGKWVSQGDRRLVLGVPMLENANTGQFDNGVNGAFDTYFLDLANELVANNLANTIIRLGYEANCDTIGPWQATDNPSGYKALFRHEVAVMKSVPGSAFKFDWTVCNGLQNGHALNSFDSFYPGNDVVDIIGIDIYDVKWQDTSISPQKRWDYIVGRQMGVNELLAFAKAQAKQISFPEWGLYKPGNNFAGGGDNPYFISQMAGLISSAKPIYQAYFNLDWGGGVLSDFPNGQAAFKQILGR